MRNPIDKSFLPLVLFLVLVIVLGFVLSRAPSNQPVALRQIPEFALPDLITGKTVTEADLQGEWIVINIWASWCSPCKQEHATLLELSKNPKLLMIGINFKDEPEDAKHWLKAKGNPYAQTLVDESGRTVFDWGAVGVPETFLVDHEGVIRQRYAGILTKEVWDTEFLPIIEGR